MNKRYILALDQGTTSSRAVLFTFEGTPIAADNKEYPQHYPKPGWVEHDPADILGSQIEAMRTAIRKANIDPSEIACIGITNQRETTILWDRHTGMPLCNAIVWQCRRTAELTEQLIKDGLSPMIREKTGLMPDAYFSATKIAWLLREHDLKAKAENGDVCFGTVDSFLLYNLCKEKPHRTDATNASRTMLFNLHTQDWDDELLKALDIPRKILPEVTDSMYAFGTLKDDILGVEIPITAVAGDQHAALFGQACFKKGMVKNTYGTGCFMLMNIGDEFKLSQNKLITTMAWRINGKPVFAYEGSVFMGGATVQWLRDELKMITAAHETEAIAYSVPDTGNVYLVPAFTGLGAPYWNMYARGTLTGMTRGTGRAHIVRAALEAIAYQSADLLSAMTEDCGYTPPCLRVDGGASANNFLMQFQADLIGVPVQRPFVIETTALGVAMMAGYHIRIYDDPEKLATMWHTEKTYSPSITSEKQKELLDGWHKAVGTALYHANR